MYQKILVPLDGSELAECVLPHVTSIARGCSVQNVIFLRVVEPLYVHGSFGGLSDEELKHINSESEANAKSYLSLMASRTKYDGATVQSEVLTGRAAEVITEYATKNSIDLIIIATHGRSGVSRWVWGSVADRILRSACVPVLMIRAPGCVPGI